MLTSFWVRCPHAGCSWSGSLLPDDNSDSWVGAAPLKGEVSFQCPSCQGEWQARVVGDDVRPIPLQAAKLQVAAALWDEGTTGETQFD